MFEVNVGKIGVLPPVLARDARRIVEEFLIINKGDPVEGHSRIAIVGTLLL